MNTHALVVGPMTIVSFLKAIHVFLNVDMDITEI